MLQLFESSILKWVEREVCIRRTKNEYRIFIGKHERETPLGRPQYECEDRVQLRAGRVPLGTQNSSGVSR